ncbi:hypothetical protein F5Y16DRAFT_135279 [Xylariaceae sp. FL0255]|nr:hypothetical protein F5Y16DRAFT_135279 [Xylariaceae sp. FL0255]
MSYVSPRGQALAVWLSVFTCITLVTTAMRFYVIIAIKPRPLHIEDAFLIVSVVASLVLVVLTFWAICNGLGAHTSELAWNQIVVQFKLLFSATWTWIISTSTCKISLLFLYLRLFNPIFWFRRVIWALIVIHLVYVIIFLVYFSTRCTPIWAEWDEILSQTNCRSLSTPEVACVATNIVLDFLVVVLPTPFIIKLQMPINKKIGICAMLSLGLGAIAMLGWHLSTTLDPAQPPDTVYELYVIALQSHLVLYFGIIAANIPILGPLFTRLSVTKILPFTKSSPSSGPNSKFGNPPSFVSFGSPGRKQPKTGGDDLCLLTMNDTRISHPTSDLSE